MDLSKIDDRFKSAFQDRRFSSIKQKDRKVKIDKRFQSMFTDERFKLKYEVDKRGKPINESSSENLKKYYRLSKKDAKQLKNERKINREKLKNLLNEDEIQTEVRSNKVNSDEKVFSSSDEDSDVESESEEESSDDSVDLARGEGNVETSSDEEEEFFKDDAVENDEHWGEIDKEAERSDEISSRLALCNMDWDRIKALDLLVLFDSFKPSSGVVKKVSIFPSEFGIEQMKQEEQHGPVVKEVEDIDNEQVTDGKEGDSFKVEKLRRYQLNRLKYYYAVIECDTDKTADSIYKECDGMEYETTSNRIDLRFIPDDIMFDEHPARDTADQIPDKDEYKAPEFVTTALNQSKVDLTWDETDRKRLAITMRKFNEDELENMDLKDFLASSSGSEEEEDNRQPTPRIGISSRTTDADQIARYRSLLLGDDDENDNEDKPNDIDMEITWEPLPEESAQNDEDSDDDSEEAEEEETVKESRKPMKRKRKWESNDEGETDESKQQRAQLEMLMMDAEDLEKTHFNIDEIVKEQQASRRKKNKKQENGEGAKDDFEINTKDDRFKALFTSSDFALDPNNPAFRKTRAMQELVEERQKRIAAGLSDNTEPSLVPTVDSTNPKESSLSQLVSSIKAKTKTQFSKKKVVISKRTQQRL